MASCLGAAMEVVARARLVQMTGAERLARESGTPRAKAGRSLGTHGHHMRTRHRSEAGRPAHSAGLCRVPCVWGPLGTPAALPDLRARRMLRLFAQPSRDRPLQGDRPSSYPILRAGRGLAMVLHRRHGGVKAASRLIPQLSPEPWAALEALTAAAPVSRPTVGPAGAPRRYALSADR
jgi:hypothetical protein